MAAEGEARGRFSPETLLLTRRTKVLWRVSRDGAVGRKGPGGVAPYQQFTSRIFPGIEMAGCSPGSGIFDVA